MSHRGRHPEPNIVEQVVETKGADWNESTQRVARTDAIRLLEALVAEYGVDGSLSALTSHGFNSASYSYLLKPLHDEAMRRRAGASAEAATVDRAGSEA